ncbi:MAG: LysM peptidoglycan-binding domain-containing protein [Gammaproteobacteria bacterium]|nr:MAG: LysM peptidoglycan-binding domain-containing protein [Gammaproteobacteria bacterium]
MSFQDLDFKSDRARLSRSGNVAPAARTFHPGLLIKLSLVATLVMLLGFSVSNWQPSAKAANSTPKLARLHYSLELPEPAETLQQEIAQTVDEIESTPWESVTIKSGDTLASIFAKKGISPATTHQIARLNEQTKQLRYIKPGQEIQLLLDEERNLRQMKYIPDITRTLLIQRTEDQSFSSRIINFQLDAYPVYREGRIENSLFEAAANADIPDDVIMDLVAIFGWDIDFSLDIRKGDRFGIVYEELYKDDVKIRNGRILAAEFTNDGKTYRAVYYTDPTGESDYFSPDGKSMRKAFLRSPVEFSRISSRFTSKRWHPLLSKWRSHKGVDYAAKRGTPVRASGDGKVIFAGSKGGYGRLIVIRHGGRYTTAYGHLHRYARGVRSGKKVKQGQIIGYVGSSGLATGPHLHYEFRVNGTHRNPLTVKLPEARPVHSAYESHFKENTQVYLSMLRLMDRTLADNSQ